MVLIQVFLKHFKHDGLSTALALYGSKSSLVLIGPC